MVTPVGEKDPASEHAKESMTAQPREHYENADCPDHCCRTCRESSERSGDGDSYMHDNGCLMYEPLPNNPSRIEKRVAEKLGIFDSRTAKPLGQLTAP
eukprot:3409008-Pyramimonas_sp.AAC.1